MSSTLRVFVGEHWPEQPSTRWVLLDAAGELLQQGESDALRWPRADFCEAVISAPGMSCLRAAIPHRVSGRDLLQVVAGVLEDQLLDDPDNCHLTVSGRRRDSVDVLVIARARLRNVLTQFSALNRPLSAAFSQLQTLPTSESDWAFAVAKDAVIVSQPDEVPLVLDESMDGAAPTLLGTLVGNVDASGNGTRFTVRPEVGSKVDLAAWKSELHSENVRVGQEYHWYALVDGAADILHGEFASRQRRNSTWMLIKPAAVVAVVAIAAYLAVGFVRLGLSSYGVHQTEGRIAELFGAAFPGVPAVAPLAQTRRHLDQLRAAHGLARSDDALVLLAAVAEVLGADSTNSVKELNYANQQLTVVFEPDKAARIDDVKRQLTDRGLQVTRQETAQDMPSLLVGRDMTK